MPIAQTYLNGQPATADQLAPLAFAGFAHFTAMQVRDHAVRGLDLHLDRLRLASDELFGQHLDDAAVRDQLASAVRAGPPDVSLTCFISSRPGEFLPDASDAELDVLVKITDPVNLGADPVRLDVVEHRRHLPEIKQVGEHAQTQYLRQARRAGFDDAAFVDGTGRLSEATIWNLAFWDGATVIWPEADLLPGITMQILRRQLAASGIAQLSQPVRVGELNPEWSAVLMNSWTPGIPVACVGQQPLACDEAFVELLHQGYRREPANPT